MELIFFIFYGLIMYIAGTLVTCHLAGTTFGKIFKNESIKNNNKKK